MGGYSISSKLFIVFTVLMPLMAGFGSVVEAPYLWKMWFSVIDMSIVLTFAAYIAYKDKDSLVIPKASLPIVLFVIWSAISLFWVVNLQIALDTVVQFFSYLVVFILAVNLLSSQKCVLTLLRSLMVTLFFVVLLGLAQYYLPNSQLLKELYFQTGSMGSVFGNRNMAVQFVIMLIPFSIALFLLEKQTLKTYFYGVVAFSSFLFLIVSTARQGYVAIIIEISVFVLFFILDYLKNKDLSLIRKIKNIRLKLLISIIAFALLITVSNIGTDHSNSKLDRFSSISQGADNSRVTVWINTIEMIKDNPIIGVGAGQWQEYYALYYNRAALDKYSGEKVKFRDVHNDYLETFSNYGLIGILLLSWLAYLSITKILRVLTNPSNPNRIITLSIAMSMIGFSVVALVSFPINWYVPGFFIMIFLGILSTLTSSNITLHVEKKYNLILALLSFLILSYTSYHVFNSYKSEYYYRLSVKNFNSEDVDLAFLNIKNSIGYRKTAKSYAKAGLYLLVMDRPKEAVRFLLEGKDRYLFNISLLLNLAESYRVSNNFDKERAILKLILDNDEKNVIASVRLVTNLVNLNMYDEANPFYIQLKYNFDYFKDVIAYGPYHSEVASVALLVKDYKYFSYVYDDLLSKTPKAEDYIVYGIIEYQRVGNKSKAKELFNKALKLDKSIEIPEEIAKDLEL